MTAAISPYRNEPSFVFAGLDPTIHDECPRMQTVRLCFAVRPHRCPGHRRAKRRRPLDGYARARQTRGSALQSTILASLRLPAAAGLAALSAPGPAATAAALALLLD